MRTRIVFGPDKIDSLGELAQEIGGSRALVVSDPGVVAAGHTERGVESLRQAGLEAFVFANVHENPTTVDVNRGLEYAEQCEPDLLVGLGGGSSMDCAKGVNFLLTNGGRMQDYWGVGKAKRPMLPMIAVPTTAGTGSETQSFALISDVETHAKMACGDKKAACRLAILDPKLTLTQPPRITALAGIDALAHALETYVSKARTPMSLTFSREAWRLLASSFGRVLDEPTDLEARSGVQLGASLAGMAIENSMLGAAHALANPLTAAYDVIHGQAIGVMLPYVIRFNGVQFADRYRELLQITDGAASCPQPDGGPEAMAEFIASLVASAGLPGKLADCGVERQRIEALAADAAQQWTGQFNPREIDAGQLAAIYDQAF